MNSRALFDSLTEENADLKARIQALERDNRGLKKSVFQLSALTSLQAAQIKKLTRSRGIADLGAVPPSVTPASMWLGSTHATTQQQQQQPADAQGVSNPNGSIDQHNNNTSNATNNNHNSTSTTRNAITPDTDPSHADADDDDDDEAGDADEDEEVNAPLPPLQCVQTLQGHKGAIYALEWSPEGDMLASASFDRTVRLWPTLAPQRRAVCLSGHQQLVSSLAFFDDGRLVSGSFDGQVKIWDVAHGAEESESFTAHGLVQAVCVDGANTLLCGTSKGSIHMFDLRTGDGKNSNEGNMKNNNKNSCNGSLAVSEVSNGSNGGVGGLSWSNTGRAMVNALVMVDTLLLTGDSHGDLRMWDLRMNSDGGSERSGERSLVSTHTNMGSQRPISHISLSRQTSSASSLRTTTAASSRCVSVNCYDDVLRLYDWRELSLNQDCLPLYSFKGQSNSNWPIKSSMFVPPSSLVDGHSDRRRRPNSSAGGVRLVATGSATSSCYLFDLSTSGGNNNNSPNSNGGGGIGGGKVHQKLRGHAGRVYACAFNPNPVNFAQVYGLPSQPNRPCLATCSADATVKIYAC